LSGVAHPFLFARRPLFGSLEGGQSDAASTRTRREDALLVFGWLVGWRFGFLLSQRRSFAVVASEVSFFA